MCMALWLHHNSFLSILKTRLFQFLLNSANYLCNFFCCGFQNFLLFVEVLYYFLFSNLLPFSVGFLSAEWHDAADGIEMRICKGDP